MNRHAEREQMANAAHQECREMTQKAMDEISVKVGWMIRSMGASRVGETGKRKMLRRTVLPASNGVEHS